MNLKRTSYWLSKSKRSRRRLPLSLSLSLLAPYVLDMTLMSHRILKLIGNMCDPGAVLYQTQKVAMVQVTVLAFWQPLIEMVNPLSTPSATLKSE